jgi:GT2 family glycosyltransferase
MTSESSDTRPGVVSVLLVNFRGADDTIECLEGLRQLDWPAERLEVIVVDNASGDDSVERIRAAHPDVHLIESPTNTGFAGGCNLAAAHSHGEHIALINSDARPHPDWLTEGVAELDADRSIGAVASKVLDWDGERIDYVGGSINFVGQGYKLEAGEPDTGAYGVARDVLFPTGSAAIIRSEAFRALGGFDERYFMFYEDVDFGWRMNLAGGRVRYVPTSIVFHKHHGAVDKLGSFREEYLLARNSLLTIYKNFGDRVLQHALPAALMLSVFDGVRRGGADPTALDFALTPDGDQEPDLTVDKRSLAGAYAVDYLAAHLRELTDERDRIQSTRVRSDGELAGLFGDLFQATSPAPGYHQAWLEAIRAFGLDDSLLKRRILVLTEDTLTARMAGPAIRAYHIADELSAEHHVKLVSLTSCTISSQKFECLQARGPALEKLGDWADVIVFQGFVMHHAPWIVDSEAAVVVDIYDPLHLEQLEQGRDQLDEVERKAEITSTTQIVNEQLERGDFFLCASEEQRHFWLGQLAGVGRLNPDNYDRDSSLRSLLAVAPFGLPRTLPAASRTALKGGVPGIGPDDKVILWGGGVYNWFDPLTLIRAVDQLRHRHDDVRLFFMGMVHPNPNVPAMTMAAETRRLANELGLTDKFVFFNEQWVDYDDRVNYLLDADVGVSTHFLHVETTFAFRTRMLDYLWAGIPIVATEGDSFARLIAIEELGVVVPERDVEALADGLERVLYDEAFAAACRERVEAVRPTFVWHSTLAPLIEFCRGEGRAPDAEIVDRRREERRTGIADLSGGVFTRNLRYAKTRYREGGPTEVVRRGSSKAKRLLGLRPPDD